MNTQTKAILCTDVDLVPPNVHADEFLLVTEDIIKKISGIQTPEGILAEVAIPQESSLANSHYILALDGIRDPGNLGTLLRTALALGWDGVFILENSADPYNDKALRAAKGSTFRLPIKTGPWSELKKLLNQNHLKALAADLEGENLDSFSLHDNIVLVLGNEAQGLSKDASSICKKITIPMKGPMESLNVAVAGGILMYSLRNHD